jgi:tetratricopeptide (TPR) repeat protein
MEAQGRPVLEAITYIAAHASVFLWLVPVWMLGAGVALTWGRHTSASFCPRPRSTALTAAVVGAIVVAVGTATLRPLAADTLLHHGSSFEAAGRRDVALSLLRRGVELAPHEPEFALRLGGALIEAARAAPPGPERIARLEQARAQFTRARQLAPLDPDHSINLSRLAAIEADLATEDRTRQEKLALAAAEVDHALELRPGWALALSDYALVEYRLGNRERAFLLVEQAIALDYKDPRVHRAAAHLHSLEAMLAKAAGDPEAEREHRERAAKELRTASSRWLLGNPDRR